MKQKFLRFLEEMIGKIQENTLYLYLVLSLIGLLILIILILSTSCSGVDLGKVKVLPWNEYDSFSQTTLAINSYYNDNPFIIKGREYDPEIGEHSYVVNDEYLKLYKKLLKKELSRNNSQESIEEVVKQMIISEHNDFRVTINTHVIVFRKAWRVKSGVVEFVEMQRLKKNGLPAP